MKITAFAIRHHVAVLVLCAGILIMGWSSYRALPRESFPDVEFPFVIVTTVLDGANPTDVEESVTIPLETELDSLEGLKEMQSQSMDSISVVSLEFQPEVETEVALRRVRDAVDQAKQDLSTEAEEPIVEEFTLTSLPVLIYHLVGDGAVTVAELDDLAEELEEDLTRLPGVLDIDVYGDREREVILEVDPERLHHYKLSLSQVQGILRGSNRNVSAGAGMSEENRIVVRIPGEFEDPGDIMELPVGFTETGVPIYVRDVATARYGFDEVESKARLYDMRGENGTASGEYRAPSKSVSLHIKKRTGYNVLKLCDDIAAAIARQPERPNVRIVKGYDQSEMVNQMVADLENGIGTSLVLVLLVIFFGLGGRNSLLVASAIPFSMLLSIGVLRLMGETLNMMVLFSLILALGMLVDNAIVIIENIYRHHSLGKTRWDAALVGTTEVAWPVITSTATTVGAFFPLIFWPGMVGKFMSFLPRTVIVVLLCSLFVALVINPTLAALFMRLKSGAHRSVDPGTKVPTYWLVRQYRKSLEFMLDHPVWTLTTAFVLLAFVIASYLQFGAGTEFFPRIDPDEVTCSVDPPEGVSITESDRISRLVEDRMVGKPGSGYDAPVQNLEYASVTVRLEGTGGGGSNFAKQATGPISMQVSFVDREFRTQSTARTLVEMRNRLEGLDAEGNRVTHPLFGAEFEVIRPQEAPSTGAPVSISILGEDLGEMTSVAQDMKRLMADTPGTVKPTDNAANAQPTVEWEVDTARAGTVGLDESTISSLLQIAVGGLKTGTFGHGDDEQDIMLQMPERYRLETDRLRVLSVPGIAGNSVPLTSVAAARLAPGPVTVNHLDGRRVVTASSEVQTGVRSDSDVREAFQERAKQYSFPPDIDYEFSGAAEEEKKARAFLGNAFLLALFIIVGVMVLQFNSLVCTGIVMCSVVLSLVGVFTGLLVTGSPFGIIMTGIGVISLAGVVVNNAIVLLDAIRQQEERGATVREAVVHASMIRFRPVLLTAITTVLGLLPMALKLNWDFAQMTWQYDTGSSQWWQGMAVAVIFGLLVSTILTLGIVPTLYMSYEKIRLAVNCLLGRPTTSPLTDVYD